MMAKLALDKQYRSTRLDVGNCRRSSPSSALVSASHAGKPV